MMTALHVQPQSSGQQLISSKSWLVKQRRVVLKAEKYQPETYDERKPDWNNVKGKRVTRKQQKNRKTCDTMVAEQFPDAQKVVRLKLTPLNPPHVPYVFSN